MKNELTNHIKNEIGKWHVIYSEDRKFIWLKNAKTAGTSMFRGVMLEEIDDVVSYKANPKEFDKWWDSLTDEKISEYFTFTFVRNPYDRLTSAFSHLVAENNFELFARAWPVLNPKHEVPIGFSFNELYIQFCLFVTRCLRYYDINDQSMYSGSSHWMPQSVYVETGGYQIVDFVGKYENLAADWKYVAKKIGVTEELPFKGASGTAQVLKKTREEIQGVPWAYYYIDFDIIDMVSEFYKRDLEILGYEEYTKLLKRSAHEAVEKDKMTKKENKYRSEKYEIR